tara:strand:+ start:2870 stop:3049 length:180 start_codon:yes stop_codon:yes gene_type:complete
MSKSIQEKRDRIRLARQTPKIKVEKTNAENVQGTIEVVENKIKKKRGRPRKVIVEDIHN